VEPERGIKNDLKWALSVLAGFVLGALIFGMEWSILVGALLAVALVVVVRTLLRVRRRRASP
jgi:hypothetical protein